MPWPLAHGHDTRMSTLAAPSAAPASGSPTPGTAAAIAAQQLAAQGHATTSDVSLTPGLEQLDDAQIAAAFMGDEIVVEEAGDKKAKVEVTETEEETETETTEESDATETTEAETETETETTETTEETEQPEGEGSDLEKGLLNALKDKPGLHKRVKGLFVQNKELKAQLEAATTQPVVITPPAVAGQMFAGARNEAEIEAQAQAVVNDARSKLRWLNRHLDGGTFGDGEHAQELTAAQVEQYIEHYENLVTSVDAAKAARKTYLQNYAQTVKPLAAEAQELVNPKTPHRESQLIRTVPELTRDPTYLQILADAKAGRELREKKAQGIQVVEVKPGQKPAANGQGKPAVKAGVKPAAAVISKPGEPPAKQALTPEALQALRAKADAGDRAAQQRLMDAFMES